MWWRVRYVSKSADVMSRNVRRWQACDVVEKTSSRGAVRLYVVLLPR